jgi:hypothetical protein
MTALLFAASKLAQRRLQHQRSQLILMKEHGTLVFSSASVPVI